MSFAPRAGSMLWWLADDERHPGVGDEFADHHAARDLVGDEQAARGLRVGQKQAFALIDATVPLRVRPGPVQVTARAAADVPVAHRLPGTFEVRNGRWIDADGDAARPREFVGVAQQ